MLALLFAFVNYKNSSQITAKVRIWKFDIDFFVTQGPNYSNFLAGMNRVFRIKAFQKEKK